MSTNIEENDTSYRVKLCDAIFCESLIKISINDEAIQCATSDCKCDTKIEFENLIDLFSRMYSLVNEIDVKWFFELKYSGKLTYSSYRDYVSKMWEEHLREEGVYDNLNDLEFSDSTKLFMKSLLSRSKDKRELLYYFIGLIQVIDCHIGDLIQKYSFGRLDIFPYHTREGVIIVKKSSKIYTYVDVISEQKSIYIPQDPDHLVLSKLVNHVKLSDSDYPSIKVVHKKLPYKFAEKLSGDVATLNMGFFSSLLDSTDIEIKCDKEIEGVGIPFHCAAVVKDNFDDQVMVKFDELVSGGSNIIMSSELFTPLVLQNMLGAKLGSLDNHLALMMPGSFHESGVNINPEKLEDKKYNYSQVFLGNGTKINDVFKMELFTSKENRVTPELIEQISFDQRTMYLLESPIGRMAVLICVDFLTREIMNILIDRHVDIIFVMACTPRPERGSFFDRMKLLGDKNNLSVFVCNNPAFQKDSDKKTSFVAYFPGIKNTFIRKEEKGIYSIGTMVDEVTGYSVG